MVSSSKEQELDELLCLLKLESDWSEGIGIMGASESGYHREVRRRIKDLVLRLSVTSGTEGMAQ